MSGGRGQDPARNLAAGVHRHAAARPEATALVVDGRRHSYAELAAAAAKVAAWLGRDHRDLARGDAEGPFRVGILASRSFETYAGILGAAWAGATYVPLNPKQPPARLGSILEQAGLAALVADERAQSHLADAEVLAALPSRLLLARPVDGVEATTWGELPDSASRPPAAVAADHPAYVLFTSGTTGLPKGVVVSAGAVAHFLAQVRDLYGIGPADRVGQFCETSFDLSVFELYAAWDGGAALHVVPESKLLSPAGFLRDQELTVWASVPSVIAILTRLRQLEPGAFPQLRVSVFIGEALPVAAARAWQAAAPSAVVDNHYGPTEATVACTWQRVSEPVLETPGRGTVAIGRAYAGMEVEVVDAEGRFLADGETGELALHGPQLAHGYLGDPAQTAERFPVLDHPRLGRSRWYRTGDLGMRDADGVLHWLGRTDHQVKILGHRVELEDLEAHLRAASGSDAVAAVAWPLTGGAATGLVAFVCGAQASPEEIRERLRESLPLYMVPRRVIAVDAMPLSSTGKVDRHALLARLDAKD